MHQSRGAAAAALVAGGGGLLTLLLATNRGRDTIRQVNDILDDIVRALGECRAIAQRMDVAAQQGTAVVAEVRRVLAHTSQRPTLV